LRIKPWDILAFNWEDPERPFSVRPLDLTRWGNRPPTALADFVTLHEVALMEPEYVYGGIRHGVENAGRSSLGGYCYLCRMHHRHEMTESGTPILGASHATETYGVFLSDGWEIIDAYFLSCDWLGKPIDAAERFAKCLYDHNAGGQE
jgi:hypothetical protein